MKTVIDTGLPRVRVWRDEAPEASYVAGETLERSVSATKRGCKTPSGSVAIEVWLPMGPRALFGLLGVRFGGDGPACEIRVPVVKGLDGPRLADTIAASYDEVRVGLPDEYGQEVVDALARGAERVGLGGRLSVEHAAHSLVGSSPRASTLAKNDPPVLARRGPFFDHDHRRHAPAAIQTRHRAHARYIIS